MQIAKEQWNKVWDDLSEQLVQLGNWLEFIATIEDATENDVAEVELLTADLFGANKRLKKRYVRQYNEAQRKERDKEVRNSFAIKN